MRDNEGIAGTLLIAALILISIVMGFAIGFNHTSTCYRDELVSQGIGTYVVRDNKPLFVYVKGTNILECKAQNSYTQRHASY